MSNLEAKYYGKLELLPNVICDSYILNNGEAVLSQKATASLLGLTRQSLNSMSVNWPPKYLKPFVENNLSMSVKFVKVTADNSLYKNREIAVYTVSMIENLICGFALAFVQGFLRQNQTHIGKQAVVLMRCFIRTALETSIKEVCGFIPDVQNTTQNHYINVLKQIQQLGFKCSLKNNIATKKDISSFLKVPQSTLNSFLSKHSYEIKPIKLDRATIQSLNSKASHMHGYKMNDIVKIVFGMDTEITATLKRNIFGDLATFAKMNSKPEITWREVLRKIFADFEMKTNYPIGKYRYFVDYFIPAFSLCLECNGYEHKYYNVLEEARREKIITRKYALIRFHHKTSLEVLFNAILKAKPGDVVKLYDVDNSTMIDFSQN